MKLSRSIYLILIFFGVSWTAQAQVNVINTDTTAEAESDTLVSADSTEQVLKIRRWKYNHSLQSEVVSSDSTLRWHIWPNWVYKKNRDPGVIGYRLGSVARTNAMLIHAHEARYQDLYWEDNRMNDPVSGTVNWDFIPLHKINRFYSQDEGLRYQSSYFLRQYNLNKPLSKLNYNESKFDYRSLEFMVSQNLSQKTNAEISYWDRRDGGEYDNSEVIGRQIYAHVFHHLDDRQAIKIHFLNNNYTIGEPFGYLIQDLDNYGFDRFTTAPRSSSAQSEIAGSTLGLNYYRRSGDTLQTNDNLHAGLFLNSRKRRLDFNSDSTFYKVQSIGANARKWLDLGPVKLEGSFSYEQFFNTDPAASSLSKDSWGVLTSGSDVRLRPASFLVVRGGAGFTRRSDNFHSYSLDVGTTLKIASAAQLSVDLSKGSVMPTPQQLYWSSNLYEGNPSLKKEQIQEARADFFIKPFNTLKVGIRGQIKDLKDAVMVGPDSVFTNVARYNSVSITPYFNFHTSRFELSGSAVYHDYGRYIGSYSEPLPVDDNKRIWLKGSGYIKGYIFDRAAFIKAGLSGMIAPFRYKASHYNPVLDFWQPQSNDQLLPVFNRLDVDVSARVRTIMVLLKWENVLDDIAQRGYFETAGYPMTQRRFIFGIRVLFRN